MTDAPPPSEVSEPEIPADVILASSLLNTLSGTEPTLGGLGHERLKRLLKPLLSAIDVEAESHRLMHDWPAPIRVARKLRKKDARLDAYLRHLRSSPGNAALRAVYADWIETHKETAELCGTGSAIPAERLTVTDDNGRTRISPDVFSTMWAIVRSEERPTEPNILGVFGQLDDILATRSVESPVEIERRIREAVRSARIEGEQRGERRAKERVARLEKELSRSHAELSDERSERARLEVDNRALGATNRGLSTELEQARRQHGQATAERDNAESRVLRVRGVLKEEREEAHASERRVAELSDELRRLQLKVDDLQMNLDATTGPAGLLTVLNRTIDDEDLKQHTTQGRPQLIAVQRIGQLKKVRDEFLVAYPEHATEVRARRVPVERKTGFRVEALGGGIEIGASCYLLEFGRLSVLVDCGIKTGEQSISLMGPELPDVENMHAVILTHAHTDHIGWLPALIARGFDGPIYCTKETNDLISIMLQDSRKQLERLMAIQNVRARFTHEELTPEPYTSQDVERVLFRLRPQSIEVPIPLSPELRFSFYRAGHILGAASVHFEGAGRRIFFTGDFSTFKQETVFAANWPTDGQNYDLVVTESTYGDRDRDSREDNIREFVSALQTTVTSGGTAVIPSFALGRAQEVLSIIAQAMDREELRRVPVWIDGMTESIDLVYQRHGCIEFPDNFHHVRSEGFSREDVISKAHGEPTIIVSTSGMLSGGPVVQYASRLLPNARNRLFFCGYQDEESPGYKLMALSAASRANRRVPVKNELGEDVEIFAAARPSIFHLSAHSDRTQMVGAIRRLAPHHVMLVHGEPKGRKGLFDALTKQGIQSTLDVVFEAPQIP